MYITETFGIYYFVVYILIRSVISFRLKATKAPSSIRTLAGYKQAPLPVCSRHLVRFLVCEKRTAVELYAAAVDRTVVVLFIL